MFRCLAVGHRDGFFETALNGKSMEHQWKLSMNMEVYSWEKPEI
jgi:hypothetical protein